MMLLLGHPGLGAQNADIYNMKRAGCGKTHAPGASARPLVLRPLKFDHFWNSLFGLLEPKKSSPGQLLAGPRAIMRPDTDFQAPGGREPAAGATPPAAWVLRHQGHFIL